MGGDKLMPEVVGVDGESEEGQAIDARRGDIFRTQYLPHLQAFPRVRELLAHMSARGLKLVVASSSQKGDVGASARARRGNRPYRK